MSISTTAWGWPQWGMLILMLLRFAVHAVMHGKPREDATGETAKFNGFGALVHFAVMLFVLICGGFFQ